MNAKPWPQKRMGCLFDKRAEAGYSDLPTLSVTMDRGLVRRDSLDRKMDTTLAPEEHLLVRAGDIAYNMMRMWQGASGMAHEDGIVSPAYVVLKPKPDVDPLFASYYFKLRQTIKKFEDYSYGLTGDRLRLYFEDFAAISTAFPPLREQRIISGILSYWDDAISLHQEQVAEKRLRKQAAMQQLLTGEIRLSHFASEHEDRFTGTVNVPSAVRRGIYPPSVQPGIPKILRKPVGWREVKMGKLLHIQNRPIQLDNDSEYQLIVAKRNRGGIEPRERLLGREIKTPTQFQVHGGDFLISRRQIIHGACGVVPDQLDGAVVSNEYAVCTVSRQLDLSFLMYLSHTLYFQQTCFHASVGVAIEKMIFKLDEWLKFPFLIPSIEEQRGIASVLSDLDSEIGLLTEKATLLEQQKQGLMQQLLTGKVRVNVDTEMVKE